MTKRSTGGIDRDLVMSSVQEQRKPKHASKRKPAAKVPVRRRPAEPFNISVLNTSGE